MSYVRTFVNLLNVLLHMPCIVFFYVWQLLGRSVPATGEARCCVILLSYKRPANMDAIARSVLRCDFCSKLIVSNNLPTFAMKDWLSVDDDRLLLMDQSTEEKPGIRFEIARGCASDYYIMIDDDMFIYPTQIKTVFEALVADPAVPHGILGERKKGRGEREECPVEGYPFSIGDAGDIEVDHLTNVYAFTCSHLNRYFELARRLGIAQPRKIDNGEDVILSFCGDGRPRIHRVGPILVCSTSHTSGIATWRTMTRFFEARVELNRRLAELTSRS
jgi:hypothetical protein